MQVINLYNSQLINFTVDPKQQNVADPSRAFQSAAPEAMRNTGIALILFFSGIGILYGVGSIIESLMDDSSIKKILHTALGGAAIGLAYNLWLKLKALSSVIIKPNLKTPQKAVKSFLSSLKNGLYNQAYNQLTDNAQIQNKIDMPRENEMQKKMPDLQFENLDGFVRFWSSIDFPWELSEFSTLKQQDIDDNISLIDAKISIKRTIHQPGETDFVAKFLVFKIGDLWFLGNGFFWPHVE